MPINLVDIIREITDSASIKNSQASVLCSETDALKVNIWDPHTDIVESNEEIIIKIELAGVGRDDVSVKVKNGKIIICGERRETLPENTIAVHQLELSYGRFEKVIHIPEFLEHNNITAKLGDGILDVRISKKSEIIEIDISDEIINY